MSTLIGLFDEYEGGEFCQGLIFGMEGSNMLTKIAQTAIESFVNNKHKKTEGYKGKLGN
jgi:hypothetical protein